MAPAGYTSEVLAPPPRISVSVGPATCADLSLFKDLLKEYRQLDDALNLRLSRTRAQLRAAPAGASVSEDAACAHFWRELVENWKRRAQLVDYCAGVADVSVEARTEVLQGAAEGAAQRKAKAELFEESVKRNQILGERTVEPIVRQRALDAFRARCKYFTPPLTDADARKWWDAAR